MLKIAINDSASQRRDKMVGAYASVGEVDEFYAGCSTTEMANNYLIVLQHYGDRDNSFAKSLQEKAVLLVYYGASGEPDPRWDKAAKGKNTERIWRLICDKDGNGALTQTEAKVLLAYAVELEAGRKAGRPSILQPPKEYNTLVAISILCQGYLVANNPHEFGIDDAIQQRIRAQKAESEVVGTSYWFDVFGNVAAMSTAVNKEWAGAATQGGRIYPLLDALSNERAPTEPVIRSTIREIDSFFKKNAELKQDFLCSLE